MTEFEKLANRAFNDLRQGDFTPALALCDFLEEHGDPRSTKLRDAILAAQDEVQPVTAQIKALIRNDLQNGRDIANLSPDTKAALKPLLLANHKTHESAAATLYLWLITPQHLTEHLHLSQANRNLLPPKSL